MPAWLRRSVLSSTLAGLAGLGAARAADLVQPQRAPGYGGSDPGPRDAARDAENPDLINPPPTDHGTLPNLRFSFADAHVRQTDAGWTRQVSKRELPVATTLTGVDMRLNRGGTRELHWHKQAEWAYVLYGRARITAVDQLGRNFVDDVGVGDLWYFPAGIPHSIQGLNPDGCEFLLVFDDGGFNEDSTFLISDWFKHVPPAVLAKNFGVGAEHFGHTPDPETRYIFPLPVPGPLAADRVAGSEPVPESFSFRLGARPPLRSPGGTVRIADSTNFTAAKTIAAALVEVAPGAMRELHWHPNADEWQYYIEGEGRMGVFGASEDARTFDFRAGDVGYVPFAMGHYIENTGTAPLRYLEMFRSDHFADISLDQWMALTPPELVRGHLNLDDAVMRALRSQPEPIVPA